MQGPVGEILRGPLVARVQGRAGAIAMTILLDRAVVEARIGKTRLGRVADQGQGPIVILPDRVADRVGAIRPDRLAVPAAVAAAGIHRVRPADRAQVLAGATRPALLAVPARARAGVTRSTTAIGGMAAGATVIGETAAGVIAIGATVTGEMDAGTIAIGTIAVGRASGTLRFGGRTTSIIATIGTRIGTITVGTTVGVGTSRCASSTTRTGGTTTTRGGSGTIAACVGASPIRVGAAMGGKTAIGRANGIAIAGASAGRTHKGPERNLRP